MDTIISWIGLLVLVISLPVFLYTCWYINIYNVAIGLTPETPERRAVASKIITHFNQGHDGPTLYGGAFMAMIISFIFMIVSLFLLAQWVNFSKICLPNLGEFLYILKFA